MNVFELVASLKLKSDDYDKGIDQATKASKKLGDAMKPSSQQSEELSKKINALREEYKKAASTVGGLTTAYNDSVAKTGATSEKSKELASKLEEAKKRAADLKAQLDPLDDSIKNTGEESKKTSLSIGNLADKLKSGLATAAKVGVTALTAASGAVVKLTKNAFDNYAEYEQLVGGVETLFGTGGKKIEEFAESVGKTVSEVSEEYNKLMTAQQTVLDNAANAYTTAGLSANEYMETVTSFSASLLQSLGGDTQKAAQVADQAIIDMSDNANKMGTDIASIQNAYQGFAKQNYTMLDNLKLGYGGTKSEMERLIKDAENMSDTFSVVHHKTKKGADEITYSYADIIEAIHIVQDNMGITGTTASEASTTIEGSISSMKAAWDNLITGMAAKDANLDGLINNFVESATTVGENIEPVVERALSGVGTLIDNLTPILAKKLPTIVEDVTPKVISAGVTLVGAFGDALVENLPSIGASIGTAVDKLFDSLDIDTNFAKIFSDAFSLISEAISTISDVATDAVKAFSDFVKWLDSGKAGAEALKAVVVALTAGITAYNIVTNAATVASTALAVAQKGVAVAQKILNAAMSANPIGLVIAGITALVAGIMYLWNTNEDFRKFWINVWEKIKTTATNVGNSIKDFFVATIPNAVNNFVTFFSELPGKAKKWGSDLLAGLWQGISDKVAWLKNQVSGVVDKIKSWFTGSSGFDEHSPSKWAAQVGAFVSEGLAQGIDSKKSEPQKKAEELAKSVYSSLKSWADKQVKYQELSLQEQIELWEEIQRQYAVGTEQYEDAEDKLFDLRKQRAKEQEQLVKDTYSAVKSWIDKETKYQELSTETQIHMWEQVQGQFETGSEQWNDAESKLFDLRKQRLKEQEQAEQDFSKKVEDVYKNIEDLEKNYAKELESRVQQISNAYKLFDAVPERQEVNGRELMKNLQGQIANIEEFYAKVQELSDRGVGDGLVESIREMGPSAIDELSALLSLTDEELGEYANLFAEKQELANNLAVEQLQGLREKTDQQIQENMDSLSGIMQSVVKESASWGSDLISEFISGIKEMEPELTYTIAGAAQLVRDYLGFSEPKKGPLSNFHTYAPDMMSLFAQGIRESESLVSNQINKSFDFGTKTVDFAASSLGRSSMGGASGYALPELPQIVFETSGDIGQIVRLLHPRLRWEDKRVGRSLVNV